MRGLTSPIRVVQLSKNYGYVQEQARAVDWFLTNTWLWVVRKPFFQVGNSRCKDIQSAVSAR